MKKMKLLFAASLSLMLSFGMVSCNKQETKPSATTTAKHSTAMTSPDDIGSLHNKGLDYYLTNMDVSDPRGCVTSLTIKYISSIGGDEKAITDLLANPDVSAIINADDAPHAMSDYFVAHGMKTENDFLANISDAAATATTPGELATILDGVAVNVSSSKDLSDLSKNALLNAISVGKASSSYWADQIAAGSKGSWVIKCAAIAGKDPVDMPDFGWRKMFMQDLTGALVGGLFTGTLAGMAGGGVGASAAEAISQLF